MTEPQTILDARFSGPSAVAISWDETRRLLEEAQLFWIGTVRRDGRPQVSPLVAVWLDDALHFSTGPEEQKAVNLRANPDVVLTTGCAEWDRGFDVMVEGVAVRQTDDAVLRRLAEAWSQKWDGRWQYAVSDGIFSHEGGGGALVFSVRPRKVLVFGKGTFSHTSHRFSA